MLLISASRISPSALCGPHGGVDAIFVCGRQVCLVGVGVDDPESVVQEGDLSFDDILDLLVQSFAARGDDWSVEVGFLYVAGDRLGAPSADKLNSFFVAAEAGQELTTRHSAHVFVESLTKLPARVWSGEVGACLLDDAAEKLDDRLFGNCLPVGPWEERVVARWWLAEVSVQASHVLLGRKAEREPGRCTGVTV